MPTKLLNARILIGALIIGSIQLSLAILAHDPPADGDKSAIEAHWQMDFGFPGFKKLNQELSRDYILFDNRVNLAAHALMENQMFVADGHINGSWSPAFQLPLVPIHAILLTNGKVLMWDSVGDLPAEDYKVHDFTRASVWDPTTNLVTNVDNLTTGYNIFCSGFAHLPNGTPFIAGGNLNSDLQGLDTTHFFNQVTNGWSLGPTMTQGHRWYPSVTPLSNGEMLITSGDVDTPEVYTTSGTLRTLSNATLSMPLYPWIQAAPKGQAFYFGPSNTMRFLNSSGNGSWSTSRTRDGIDRDYGSYAMYDIGKIVASGGDNSSKKTVMIDVINPNVNPVVTVPADMAFGRRQHNLTILPDGTVLATGGNDSGAGQIDLDDNVFDAELWNPDTRTWRTVSSASKVRQYHSTALLLPDGRIFTGGGGICAACHQVGYLEKNLEMFTPPYLYNKDGSGTLAPRPTITTSPSTVNFDQSFFVETPNAANISQAVMMRVSSVTHSIDFEQRRVPLVKSIAPNGLNLKAPPNSYIAPPGYYMLFLIDNDGVPSIAKFISVQAGSNLGAPLIVAAIGGNSNATISWTPVLGANNYRIKYGPTPGFYPDTLDVGNVTTKTVTGLTHPHYYFVVLATNGSNISGDSAEKEVSNLTPTAAEVTVSGRVVSPAGRGLSQVQVLLSSSDGTSVRRVATNSFGYYRFDGVTAGRSYFLTVSSKRYAFADSTRVLELNDNIDGVDFVSDP